MANKNNELILTWTLLAIIFLIMDLGDASHHNRKSASKRHYKSHRKLAPALQDEDELDEFCHFFPEFCDDTLPRIPIPSTPEDFCASVPQHCEEGRPKTLVEPDQNEYCAFYPERCENGEPRDILPPIPNPYCFIYPENCIGGKPPTPFPPN